MEKHRRRAVALANYQLRHVLRVLDQARDVDAANFIRRGNAINSAKNEPTNDTACPCCPDVVGVAICIVCIEFPSRRFVAMRRFDGYRGQSGPDANRKAAGAEPLPSHGPEPIRWLCLSLDMKRRDFQKSWLGR
jgi:hypothetical protein